MKRSALKRLMATVIAVGVMMGGLSIPAMAASYTDVKEGDWFYPYVMDVSDKGLMLGYGNGSFGASDKLTRGQFATILYQMAGTPSTDFNGKFPDVANGVFYSEPVSWASNNQIIVGYSNGYFGVNDVINREQMAAILYRYAVSTGKDSSFNGNIWSYPDGEKVSKFARIGMSYAIGHKIIVGSNGHLDPQGSVVRAVAATMISQFTASNQETPAECEHDFIHFEAEGHMETITIVGAWDEPVYGTRYICNTCGYFTKDGEDIARHIAFSDAYNGCQNYRTDEIQIGTIHHEAVTEEQWVEDVPEYYKCSKCGKII